MVKRLLADTNGLVLPPEMVLILAIAACLTAIGWAIGREETMDLHVMPVSNAAVVEPNVDMDVDSAGITRRNTDDAPVSTNHKVIEFVDVCGSKTASQNSND